MFKLILTLLILNGCAVSSEPAPSLPSTCEMQTEYVRAQLCPGQAVALVCGTEQTNPAASYCDGPDWTEGHQETGNAWCCDADSGFGVAR